jgi:homoserine kinase type II
VVVDSLEGAFVREQITEIVESFYDIGTVTAVNEIFGGYNNRSFGIETLKDEYTRTYFLRQYKPGVTADEICFEHALIGHAIRNGFTFAAGIVATVQGATFVQSTDSGHILAVFDYLNGEDKYTWDNPDLTEAEFISAGRVLAAFHNAVHDFDPGGLQRSEPSILELWPRYAEQLAGYARQKPGGQLQTYYTAHLPGILNLIACSPLDSTEAENMPVIAIHCDYHPGNLKWTNDQVVGIFDFDWSKMDLRLFDVAMAVIYFCSRWDEGHDGELRCDKCELFIGAYQQELQKMAGLEPITPAERGLMPKMLEIANIYLLHWEISAYHNMAGADEYEYLTYLKHNVRLMHWLDAHRSAVIGTVRGTD